MTEPRSLTVDKSLIERLQPLICCSESMATCRDDEFCSSDPKEWPLVTMWPNFQNWSVPNGSEKTRLTYPKNEDDDKKSIPATAEFCGAYMSWYTKTGCGALVKEIANNLEAANYCVVSSNFDDLIQKVLKHTPRKRRHKVERMMRDSLAKYVEPYVHQCDQMSLALQSIQESVLGRCAIMYDESDAGLIFNPERAGDLNGIARYCQWAQETGQKPGQDGYSWTTFLHGGGAAGILLTLWLLFKKIIKGIGKAGDQVTAAGTGLDKLTKGLGHLFSVSIPNFFKTAGYIFSFKWVKGKKPPKLRTDQETTTAEVKQDRPASDPHIQPDPDVVREQLASLAKSQKYADWGQRFNEHLGLTAQKYLADHAIEAWYQLCLDLPAKMERYKQDDARPMEGKIPIGFLIDFAKLYLKNDKMLGILERSAKAWAEKNGEKYVPKEVESSTPSESEFKPRPAIVTAQLISEPWFINLEIEVQKYIAKKAVDKWTGLKPEERQTFVGESDEPKEGILPKRFIRMMRKSLLRHIEIIKRRAFAFAQIGEQLPELAVNPFRIVDRRADQLLSAWNRLPEGIRQEFRSIDGVHPETSAHLKLPKSFVKYMRQHISIGTKAREPIIRSPEPWNSKAAPEIVYKDINSKKEINLKPVMEDLIALNEELSYYHEVLELRARSIAVGWLSLPNAIQKGFINQDTKQGEEIGRPIPKSYIIFLYDGAAGLGKGSRPAVGPSSPPPTKPGDDPEDRGGGKGGTPPPSGPAGAGSGTPTGSPQAAKSQSANRVKTTVSVGGVCEITPSRSQQPKRLVPPAVWRRRRAINLLRGAGIMTGAQMVWPQIGISPNMIRPIPAGVAH